MKPKKSFKVFLRDLLFYCGVSKTEFESVKNDALAFNFVVWKFLHIFLAFAFALLGFLWLLLEGTSFSIVSSFLICGYCIVVFVLFQKVFDSSYAESHLIIYITMTLLLGLGMMSGLQFPGERSVQFMVLLVILPMFIIDMPYRTAIILIVVASIYSFLVSSIKIGQVLYADLMSVWVYALMGIIVNFFYNNIKLNQFLLAKQEKKHLQEEIDLNRERQEMSSTIGMMSESILELLGDVVESRDHDSGEHVFRVRGLTNILANRVKDDLPEYGLTKHDVDLITYTSVLHDVGKIAISDTILLKPARLSREECSVMKTHCEKGCKVLDKMEGRWAEEYLKTAKDICLYHHEKWDGGGYPFGLKGDDIPISAQIVSIADIYDALTSDRVYKKAYAYNEAFDMIMNGQCGEFSGKILGCLLRCKNQLEEYARHPSELVQDLASMEISTETVDESKPRKILIGLHDEEKTMQEKEKLSEELSAISTVSDDLYQVFYIDLEKNEVKKYYFQAEFKKIIDKIDKNLNSREKLDKLLREVIVPIDYERFRRESTNNHLKEVLEKEDKLHIDFRIMLGDGIHFCRMKIKKAPNSPNAIIMGIINIDELHKHSSEALRLNKELEETRRVIGETSNSTS